MTTVVVLGGYEVFGSAAAASSVGRKDGGRVVVAGRSRAKAHAAGRSLGEAHAV